jgi:hypothetical protein
LPAASANTGNALSAKTLKVFFIIGFSLGLVNKIGVARGGF